MNKEYVENKYDFSNQSEIVPGENGYCSFKIMPTPQQFQVLSPDVILTAIFQDIKSLIRKSYPNYSGRNTVVSVSLLLNCNIDAFIMAEGKDGNGASSFNSG